AGSVRYARSGSQTLFRQGTSLGLSYCPHLRGFSARLGAFGDQLRVKYADVGQVPVSLGEIEAVADHESVGDFEADVPDRDVDLAALRLRRYASDRGASG